MPDEPIRAREKCYPPVWLILYIYIFGLVMGHQTMLNPELEDHTGGYLGYLNSLFNRLFCFGQKPTPDIRNKIYFRRFGLAAFFRDTLVTITLVITGGLYLCILHRS